MCTSWGLPRFGRDSAALSITVILFLSKMSFLDYNLIGLGLQVKFKNRLGKCSHKCTNS